jgi:cyanophycinase
MPLGPLLLAGGAEFDERMDEADRAWLASRRIGVPRVGVFPTANIERPDRAAANGVAHFRRLATHAEAVMVTTRDTTEDERILTQIEKLDFAYFAGGEPLHLADVLRNSPAWQALHRRWREGMGVGGSSAGAMVMCEAIFVREQWAEGVGAVPGTVCLPHFNRRDESAIERARVAVTARGHIGLGVDESTGLVWDGRWRVAGPGKLWVLSNEGAARYSAGAEPPGVPAPGSSGTEG